MIRVRNWDLALRAWADTMLGQPFAWGTTDCASLAIAALGVLYPAPLTAWPAWDSKAGALRLLATSPDVVATTFDAIGARALPAGFATTGDLITAPTATGEPGVLVVLNHAVALATDPDRGVHLVPLAIALAAPDAVLWRVPDE